MTIKLEIATTEDAPAIASLRVAVAEDLTSRYGKGPWSSCGTEKGRALRHENLLGLCRAQRNKLVATLTLSTRKPWAIDRKYFTACIGRSI